MKHRRGPNVSDLTLSYTRAHLKSGDLLCRVGKQKEGDEFHSTSDVPGTLRPLPTELLDIPLLNLSGMLPEQQNAVVKLDLALTAPAPGGGATADFTAWPEFHNGVAAGKLCTYPVPSAQARQQLTCVLSISELMS